MSVSDPTPSGSTHPLAVLLDQARAGLVAAQAAVDQLEHLMFEAGRDE